MVVPKLCATSTPSLLSKAAASRSTTAKTANWRPIVRTQSFAGQPFHNNDCHHDEFHGHQDANTTCSLCHEYLLTKSSIKERIAAALPCGHCFHVRCFEDWQEAQLPHDCSQSTSCYSLSCASASTSPSGHSDNRPAKYPQECCPACHATCQSVSVVVDHGSFKNGGITKSSHSDNISPSTHMTADKFGNVECVPKYFNNQRTVLDQVTSPHQSCPADYEFSFQSIPNNDNADDEYESKENCNSLVNTSSSYQTGYGKPRHIDDDDKENQEKVSAVVEDAVLSARSSMDSNEAAAAVEATAVAESVETIAAEQREKIQQLEQELDDTRNELEKMKHANQKGKQERRDMRSQAKDVKQALTIFAWKLEEQTLLLAEKKRQANEAHSLLSKQSNQLSQLQKDLSVTQTALKTRDCWLESAKNLLVTRGREINSLKSQLAASHKECSDIKRELSQSKVKLEMAAERNKSFSSNALKIICISDGEESELPELEPNAHSRNEGFKSATALIDGVLPEPELEQLLTAEETQNQIQQAESPPSPAKNTENHVPQETSLDSKLHVEKMFSQLTENKTGPSSIKVAAMTSSSLLPLTTKAQPSITTSSTLCAPSSSTSLLMQKQQVIDTNSTSITETLTASTSSTPTASEDSCKINSPGADNATACDVQYNIAHAVATDHPVLQSNSMVFSFYQPTTNIMDPQSLQHVPTRTLEASHPHKDRSLPVPKRFPMTASVDDDDGDNNCRPEELPLQEKPDENRGGGLVEEKLPQSTAKLPPEEVDITDGAVCAADCDNKENFSLSPREQPNQVQGKEENYGQSLVFENMTTRNAEITEYDGEGSELSVKFLKQVTIASSPKGSHVQTQLEPVIHNTTRALDPSPSNFLRPIDPHLSFPNENAQEETKGHPSFSFYCSSCSESEASSVSRFTSVFQGSLYEVLQRNHLISTVDTYPLVESVIGTSTKEIQAPIPKAIQEAQARELEEDTESCTMSDTESTESNVGYARASCNATTAIDSLLVIAAPSDEQFIAAPSASAGLEKETQAPVHEQIIASFPVPNSNSEENDNERIDTNSDGSVDVESKSGNSTTRSLSELDASLVDASSDADESSTVSSIDESHYVIGEKGTENLNVSVDEMTEKPAIPETEPQPALQQLPTLNATAFPATFLKALLFIALLQTVGLWDFSKSFKYSNGWLYFSTPQLLMGAAMIVLLCTATLTAHSATRQH